LRFQGKRAGQIVRLKSDKISVGSSPRCTLRLRHAGVARVHCLIIRGHAQTIVRRWSSDTRLNGATFDDAALTPGDRLSIGPIDFEVIADGLHTLPPEALAAETDRAVTTESGSTAVDRAAAIDQAVESPIDQTATASIVESVPAAKPEHPSHDLLQAAKATARQRAKWLLAQLRIARGEMQEMKELIAAQHQASETHELLRTQGDGDLLAVKEHCRQLQESCADKEQLLAVQRQELNALSIQLAAQKEALAARDHSLDTERTALTQRLADLENQRVVMDAHQCQWDEVLRQQDQKQQEQRAELEQAQAALKDAQHELELQHSALEKEKAEWNAAQARHGAELDRRQSQLEKSQAAFQQQQAAAKQRKQELATRQHSLDDQQRSLDERRSALDSDRKSFQSERASLEAQREAFETQREAQETQRLALQAERKQFAADCSHQTQQLQQQEGLKQQQLLEASQSQLSEAEKKLSQRETSLAADAKQLESHRQELEAARQRHETERQRQAAELKAQADALDRQKSELQLQRQLFEQKQQKQEVSLAKQTAELEQNSVDLAEREAELAAREQSIAAPLSPPINSQLSEQEELPVEAEIESESAAELNVGDSAANESLSDAKEDEKEDDVFARLRALSLLKTDDAKASTAPAGDGGESRQIAKQPTPPIAPATPELAPDKPHEEESIDDYMSRLLTRMRGMTGEPQRGTSPKPAVAPVQRAADDEIKDSEVDDAAAKKTALAIPVKMEPRTLAPEKTRDLAAMREIANFTARAAIASHQHRHISKRAWSSLAVGIVGLVCGAFLIVWADDTQSPFFYGGLAGLVVSLYWFTKSGWHATSARGIRRKKRHHAATIEKLKSNDAVSNAGGNETPDAAAATSEVPAPVESAAEESVAAQ
jgi:hypothetical protein